MNKELREQSYRESYSRNITDNLDSWMQATVKIDTENRTNREQNNQFEALAKLQQRLFLIPRIETSPLSLLLCTPPPNTHDQLDRLLRRRRPLLVRLPPVFCHALRNNEIPMPWMSIGNKSLLDLRSRTYSATTVSRGDTSPATVPIQSE